MNIVVLTPENYESYRSAIARIHKSAYSSDHLTAHFSADKLATYYRHLVEAGELSILASTSAQDPAGTAVGLIVGGRRVSHGVTTFLAAHRLYVAGVLLRRPRFLVEKACAKLKAWTSPKTAKRPGASFRLLSIAVDATKQSSGVGAAMLRQYEERLGELGIASYGLSVRTENGRAIKFYLSKGFQKEREYLGSTYLRKDI